MPELEKTYEPKQVEARLYRGWRERGYFAPRGEGREPFTVVLPPPNVTGRLHMGHALTATIEDTLVRWHRMRGHDALWLPGTDHAGIATQVMVERELARESGQTRQQIGREAFLARVWAWKDEHGGIIDEQHAALGASLDWSRYRFTMDDVSSRAVREAFVRLHEQGLVYRAYRLINWDHDSQTALSDLEVEHVEQRGKLWYLAYPVEGSDEVLVVATTRPETMLGDSGVAVHPDDPRYRHLVGRHCILPLTRRRIPIVGDAILVDMEFGTGAVKVTPAHDFNDFETGKRHGLEVIQIIDVHGRLCAPAPERFRGLDVAAAREAVLAALTEDGALVRTEEHVLKIGRSQRSGVVVEPLPSSQWFVDVRPMAAKALAAVRNGETTIIPEHRTNDYYRWMENIHDWCISRQLWWGHRIPAWYCGDCEQITVAREDPSACSHCGSTNIHQDEDVLDTWFSSGLWPLTTLGWPGERNELARHYPTSLMETGWDILFFWVARMMMFGLHFTGQVPFRKVFLHSMVLGEDGHKMSKTKGNVVDPVELIEHYGADALRFYLATMAGQDAGIVFSRARVEGYRNFCTKLWNAARFALMHLGDYDPAAFEQRVVAEGRWTGLGFAERWILRRVARVAHEVDRQLEGWRLDLAAHELYQFVWRELCDWYLELAKSNLRPDAAPEARLATQGTLATVLDVTLRLLHPITPFLTEEIWLKLPRPPGSEASLMIAAYPHPGTPDWGPLPAAARLEAADPAGAATDDVAALVAVVQAVRNFKSELGLAPTAAVAVRLRAPHDAIHERAQRIGSAAAFVGRFGSLRVSGADEPAPRHSIADVAAGIEVHLELESADLAAARARLERSLQTAVGDLESLERKLDNRGFVEKAPAHVVDAERKRSEELRELVERRRTLLGRLTA